MMRTIAQSTRLLRHRAASGVPVCSTLPSSSGSAAARQLWHACSALRKPAPHTSLTNRRRSVVVLAGLPFSLHKPHSRKCLNFRTVKWVRRFPLYTADSMVVEVDMMSEGKAIGLTTEEIKQLLEELQQDAESAVPLALQAKQQTQPQYRLPAVANLSLVLCDDAHIQQLNKDSRGKDAPTDVLSFEIPDEAPGLQLPVRLLGDLVISLDTAQRQADAQGHSLLTELRVLLVHGLLHLAGFDHEQGDQQLRQMAQHEEAMLTALGWEGSGLISAVTAEAATNATSSQGEQDAYSDRASTSSSKASSSSSNSNGSEESVRTVSTSLSSGSSWPRWKPQVPLVALDMDGTLLDSSSRIRPESAAVIKAATAAGVRVVLATGKARPAAIAAARDAGLEGDTLLVSQRTPGVFLQGLAVHGHKGQQLSDAALPAVVVEQAFRWSAKTDVSCVAFLGDECATLKLTNDLRELHTRYYEPLAEQLASIEQLLAGPAVRKLLFMADPHLVDELLKPHWNQALQGQAAQVLQAVPTMLEVVPAGVNKWAGLQVLLHHLQLSPHDMMAVGDGSNDLEMVTHAGLGVAMGNAVQTVREAAAVVVASNDDGGIAEAFERFVL